MNILEDIKDIVKDDKEHLIAVKASWDGIYVYLEYDPDKEFEENCIIPIFYDVLDEFPYIPDDELKEKWNPSDYGIDYNEICLIKNIMEYFNEHKEEIKELCSGFDFETKKKEVETDESKSD
jgi:hypothetical protein